GFTCPNRDGTKGRGGCTYCNNDAFNPSYCQAVKPIRQQVMEGIRFHQKRYKRASEYMVYFQAYSNTYAPVQVLKEKYEEALDHPRVKGIVIGTRPDCINDEILDYLAELKERTYLTVEFGIESCYDKTLKLINRGHDFATTREAYQGCVQRGIRTGGHMIIGLPGESREEILKEAEILSELKVNQLKFHQLQLVKGTVMGKDYLREPEKYKTLELEEYLLLMKDFIERLNPEIVIERIAGETVPEYNLRPSWGIRYDQVLLKFEEILKQYDSWQGKHLRK
ncbi:MAG: TIGR01212 family radical SAM protein, partial [Bacteroidales bacterium]